MQSMNNYKYFSYRYVSSSYHFFISFSYTLFYVNFYVFKLLHHLCSGTDFIFLAII